MVLISRREFVIAATVGGLVGIFVTATIMFHFNGRLGITELFAGAWIGSALTCAVIMIKNSSTKKGSG